MILLQQGFESRWMSLELIYELNFTTSFVGAFFDEPTVL